MEIEKICDLGRAVIETEAKMIASLAARIDQRLRKRVITCIIVKAVLPSWA